MSTGEMVASNQRPIPLIRRPDLQVATIDYLGVGYQVIKDPVGLKYHRLQVEQYQILELLNGERSLEEVRDQLREYFPTLQITLGDIQQLITDLHKKGLVLSNRPGQGASVVRERRKERNQKIKQTLMSLLYLRLPGWDPEQTLRWMYPYVRWMFRPWAVTTCMIFVATAWLLLGANFNQFRGRLPEFQSFFGWPNLIYLWVTLGIAKVIHEFGHGISCHHYGSECHEMGLMLLVFSPCLYCDVTDSWMMKNKWHRIIIGAAGMYIEVILSGIAIYVWWFTKPGMLNYLALNTFFVTTITTVIFNANPLMRFDGYYMMSDFLEIPNLRAKSDKLLREAFSWYCLGIESRPDPFMPETGRAWFITYAIAAWLYRWVILVSISLFLYTVLKPYDLQSVGVTLMLASMSGIIFSMFRNVYQIIATPRQEPMSKIKIGISLTILSAVVWAGVAVPIPWHHEAPFLVEPQEVRTVTTPFGGRLMPPQEYAEKYEELEQLEKRVLNFVASDQAEFIPGTLSAGDIAFVGDLPAPSEYSSLPQPGEEVTAGQVLVVIEDAAGIADRDELFERAYRLAVQAQLARKYRLEDEFSSRNDVISGLIADLERIRELVRLQALRVVRVPENGLLVAAKRAPEPKRDEADRMKLPRWHGTPLDGRNLGCFVEVGTELAQIAPRGITSDQGSAEAGGYAMNAVLYVDQGDRDDLAEDADVQLKFDHLVDKTYVGRIEGISPKTETMAPEALTTAAGGPLNTAPGDDGKQILATRPFRALIPLAGESQPLEGDTNLIRPGMRGTARFLVSNRSAWDWLRRYVAETFRFTLG